jgi:putative methanogenesis marker protein 5
MLDPPFDFGCVGCERSNEMVKYLISRRGIPHLTVRYPDSEEDAKVVVGQIKGFLEGLK